MEPTSASWVERRPRRISDSGGGWRQMRRSGTETKDRGALLRGARLLKAKEWLAGHQMAPAAVHSFVNASLLEEEDAHETKLAHERAIAQAAEAREKAEREIAAERDQRFHEQRRAYQRLRRASTYLGVAVVGLLIAGGWAWYQTSVSRTETERARTILAANHFREGVIRLDEDKPIEAMPFYAAALRLDPDNDVIRAAALDVLLTTRWPRLQFHHREVVRSAAFNADGTRVVTASGDDTARVWDVRTGRPIGAPLQHADDVTSAAFSTDGTRVADGVRRPHGAGMGRADRATGGRAAPACELRHVGGVQCRRHAGGDGVETRRRGCGTRGRGNRWRAAPAHGLRRRRRRSAPTARAW